MIDPESKRSKRRHQRERIFARILHSETLSYYDDPVEAEKWARKHIDTRVVCSGPCCGNPRKHFGERTRQERRADLMPEDEVDWAAVAMDDVLMEEWCQQPPG